MTAIDPAGPPAGPTPDPHGQAALLLVESLIHGLVESRALTLVDAVAVLQVARDAQVDMADAGRSDAAATHLLDAVLQSLEIDVAP